MQTFIRNSLIGFSIFTISVITVASPAGNIDFNDLSNVYGEPKVEINLGSGLISMVSTFARHDDPEVAQLLNKLENVKVRVYNLNNQSVDHAFKSVDSVTKMLRKDKWEPIVSVNEEGEKVRIFTKLTNEVIDGLVVMAVNAHSGEAVFINIVGEINPAEISKVTQSLNMDFDYDQGESGAGEND